MTSLAAATSFNWPSVTAGLSQIQELATSPGTAACCGCWACCCGLQMAENVTTTRNLSEAISVNASVGEAARRSLISAASMTQLTTSFFQWLHSIEVISLGDLFAPVRGIGLGAGLVTSGMSGYGAVESLMNYEEAASRATTEEERKELNFEWNRMVLQVIATVVKVVWVVIEAIGLILGTAVLPPLPIILAIASFGLDTAYLTAAILAETRERPARPAAPATV